jgi:hypothetical protein
MAFNVERFHFSNKTLPIIGIKGHRTLTYSISDELIALLLQIPRTDERIFAEIRNSEHLNDVIRDYKKRLAQETGTQIFLKIVFVNLAIKIVFWRIKKEKK